MKELYTVELTREDLAKLIITCKSQIEEIDKLINNMLGSETLKNSHTIEIHKKAIEHYCEIHKKLLKVYWED